MRLFYVVLLRFALLTTTCGLRFSTLHELVTTTLLAARTSLKALKDSAEKSFRFTLIGITRSSFGLSAGALAGSSAYACSVVFLVNQMTEQQIRHHLYATIGELMVGLSDYFVFYNSERPYQSLGQQTPDVVYRCAVNGGAMIADKFGGAVEQSPVPLRSTGDCSTAETKATTKAEAKPGQRRPAAREVECTA